ncbi:hypothetical protein QE152_g8966 [Popillia japonica]|uniref:Uncharacterized protein n=1 Tax=Popillia japonica TaxID=7064 RepID=A0AAW1LWE2_POPJA
MSRKRPLTEEELFELMEKGLSDIECMSDDNDDYGWESDLETENSDLPEADEAHEGIITNEEVETAGIQNEIATQPGTSREKALSKKNQICTFLKSNQLTEKSDQP